MTRSVLTRLPLVLAAVALVVVLAQLARADPYTEPVADPATPTARFTVPPEAVLPDNGDVGEAQQEQNEQLGGIPILQGLTVFYLAAVLSIVGIGLWFAAWWVRDSWRWRTLEPTGRAQPAVAPAGSGPLPQAVVAAQVVLEQGPAREAVVACWLLLQRAGAQAGTAVLETDTSREYADRLASEQLVSQPALRRLAALYREARFSDHPVGEPLRTAARRELAVLQAELNSGVRL